MTEKQFETVAEFQEYYNKIPDDDVKKWTTKEWLDMYRQLDETIVKDHQFQVQAINAGKGKYSDNSLYSMKYMQLYFMREAGHDTMKHLYKNYKFPEEEMKAMIAISKNIGHNLAQKKIDLSQSNVVQLSSDTNRLETGRKVDQVVWEETNYGKFRFNPWTGEEMPKHDVLKSDILPIKENDSRQYTSLGVQRFKDDKSSEIRLSTSTVHDEILDTSVHEMVHAYMQVGSRLQQEQLQQHIKPVDSMSSDFLELLKYNQKYYLRSNEVDSSDEAKKEIESYKKQPVEKMAQVIGLASEHYFRQETQQYTERAARQFTLFVNDAVPGATMRVGNNEIALVYSMNEMKVKDEKEFQQKYLKYLDEDAKKQIGLMQRDGYLCAFVPQSERLADKMKEAQTKQFNEEIALRKMQTEKVRD